MLFQRIFFFTVEQANFQTARLQKLALELQAMYFNPLGKRQQRYFSWRESLANTYGLYPVINPDVLIFLLGISWLSME